MPERTVRDFPLFPLGLVALPHELVPLHVFEERYRIMFDELLESEGEFGIVWADEAGLKAIGCACEIDQVLERMEDGRLNVLTRGTRPFRIVERQHDMPYPAATIEFLADKAELPTRARPASPAPPTPSSSRRPPTAPPIPSCLPPRARTRWQPASTSVSTQSRACSTCAPRTLACAW